MEANHDTEPATPDPRDRRDDGLQDARDDSDPGPDCAHDWLRLDGRPIYCPYCSATEDADRVVEYDDPGTLDVDDDRLDPITGLPERHR
jgi:hypothetical protein